MKSRRYASTKNAAITLISQFIKVLGSFIIQTIFVRTLGTSYLGANGLFTNLIVFLSFAELGIGTAFSFSLYEPIAKKNYKEISAIMTLYRKVYNLIGIIILFAGTILTFFVPFLTKGDVGIANIRFYFFLYLLSTVVSYFFTYNRSLLIADQCGYIDSINQLIYSLLRYILQGIALLFKSYTGYLIAQVVANIFANLSITHLTKKKYKFLNEHSIQKPSNSVLIRLKQNVIGTISSKIGSVVVNGTDNILISKFVGLATVGLYSNYSLIITSISNILNQVLNSVVSSFGNLGVMEKNNKVKQLNLFYQFMFYNAFVVFLISLTSSLVFQPFITLWLGTKFKLKLLTVDLIIINFVFSSFRPALNLINAYGLFWGYRYKSIVEAVFNFVISLILVSQFKLGINGVLIGTILSNILINSWWDPLILFSGAYKSKISKYYFIYWCYLIIFLILLVLCNYIAKEMCYTPHSFVEFLFFSIIVFSFIIIILLLLFAFTTGEKDMFRRIIKRRIFK